MLVQLKVLPYVRGRGLEQECIPPVSPWNHSLSEEDVGPAATLSTLSAIVPEPTSIDEDPKPLLLAPCLELGHRVTDKARPGSPSSTLERGCQTWLRLSQR